MKRAPAPKTHLCLTCSLADWDTTSTGRLHSNGEGRCKWSFPDIPMPAVFYYGSGTRTRPTAYGGAITRLFWPHNKPITACELYERKP